MSRRKGGSLTAIQSKYGRLFVLPWEIGFVLFFLIPIVSAIVYSFSHFDKMPSLHIRFVGLENYVKLMSNVTFLTNFSKSLTSFAYTLPMVVILSLIFAVILNQNFRGRLLARALFFLPVIIATGVVMKMIYQALGPDGSLSLDSQGVDNAYLAGMVNVGDLMGRIGLPDVVVSALGTYISRLFVLIWGCGIQIILFLAGLQSIPDQLYEVSRVEGATAWEEFWFITIPMLSRIIMLTTVFTMIDFFTNSQNLVMDQAYTLMQKQLIYDSTAAMLWYYFSIVSVIMAVVVLALRQWFKRYD